MEGDDDEASARCKNALSRRKPSHQLAQLVVDVDPERLERAGRRMASGDALAPEHAGDKVGELARAFEGPLGAPRDDAAGNRPGAALLAEVEQDVGKVGFF